MSELKQNIMANFIGKGLITFVTFIFIPSYIYFLGIQAYGLIGFYITLQSVFFIFDAGLSTTLNRELARLSAQNGKEQEAHDLVRTLETIYLAIAGAIILITVLISPFISNNWINSGDFSPSTIQLVVVIMGLTIAFQFPYSLYSGGLIGMQKQILLNFLDVGVAILRTAGAVLILWLVSPTIQVFFLWQMLAGLLQTFITRYFLLQNLPVATSRPRFHIRILYGVLQFTIGISIVSILAMLLTQIDKLILSKILTLEVFGCYMLASTISSALRSITVPVFNGIFPRLSQLVVQGSEDSLKKIYHQSCQLMSVLVFPVAIVIILFSLEIIRAWTQNSLIAEKTYVIASLLVAGTALNALVNMPFALQLASGWTKLALYLNLIAVILLVPLVFFLAINYGGIGAAVTWVILNGGYVVIGMFFMHRRLLKGELKKWYLIDLGLPLSGALIIPCIVRLFIPLNGSLIILMLELFIILILSLYISAFVTPFTRELIIAEYKLLSGKVLKSIHKKASI